MPGKSSIGFSGFEKFTFFVEISKFSEISKISKIFEKITNPSREALLLYELSEREPGWRFTARCHTETVAKPGRLGPAQNGELMQNFIEWTMFCMMIEEKSPRICCSEHIED